MNKRVLIVDDSKTEVEIAAAMLKNQGYLIDSAYNGKEALILIEKKKFDIILLDIVMPEMDGYTFLRELRSRNIDIPVVMITQKKENDMKGLFSIDKYTSYLEKPFKEDTLLSAVKSILG